MAGGQILRCSVVCGKYRRHARFDGFLFRNAAFPLHVFFAVSTVSRHWRIRSDASVVDAVSRNDCECFERNVSY